MLLSPPLQGCIQLLERSGIPIAGKNAVVVGRSNIVGMPAAMLLLGKDATVTIVHSRTKDPKEFVKTADIVFAAAGKAEMVRGSSLGSLQAVGMAFPVQYCSPQRTKDQSSSASGDGRGAGEGGLDQAGGGGD